MDFESSLESVDLTNYIDNSEWELLSIEFEKGVHTYACCPEPHPGKQEKYSCQTRVVVIIMPKKHSKNKLGEIMYRCFKNL